MQLILKRACAGFLWLLLLLPALQAKFRWLPELPLAGAYTVAPRAEWSRAGMADNSYQGALERYLEDRIGFRTFVIRLRNQLGYSVFHESWASSMGVGRHGVLFEVPMDAYLGTDYVGDAEVALNVRRFRVVQDTLARHGVQLVFVIAPGKPRVMAESLPPAIATSPRTLSNYEAYAKALPAAGVHTLDFSRALRRWKRTAPYPVATTGGAHWSMYGGLLAADSLFAYLRHTLHVTPAPFRTTGYDLTTTPRDTDDDLAKTLNLLWPAGTEQLAYPKLEFPGLPAGQARPNLLLIADSFGWTWASTVLEQTFSDQSRYWYYNTEVVWPGNTPEGRDLSQLKRRDQYLGRDVIVVMFNERNLAKFDKGFSREVFNLFYPLQPADHARYAALMRELRAQATWEESTAADFEMKLGQRVADAISREQLNMAKR